jgi:hypothetical protein
MNNFRQMQNITVGIYEKYGYDTISSCMKHAFDESMKHTCAQLIRTDPSSFSAILLYPVSNAIHTHVNIILQGLQAVPYLFSTRTSGMRQSNGTWTGALGLMQSATIDTLSTASYMTLKKNIDFTYTTPFVVEKYAALMKRHTTGVYVDIDSLGAGVEFMIYALSFLILLFLLLVSMCHERLNGDISLTHKSSNSFWHLLLSLFPSNGQMWPCQTGVTRKVLMTTSGFGILILSSLYQAKLSEQLLIPYPPPIVTLNDIEHLISSGNARLFIDNTAVREYVSVVSPALSESMNTAEHMNVSSYLDMIQTSNVVFIETEYVGLSLLSTIPPAECANYVYVPLNEWTHMYSALVMRKGNKQMLEDMNVVVAERMSYVDEYIQTFQLDKECSEHIFPVYEANPKYKSLQLLKITGVLAFLFLFLCISVFILFAEIIWCKCKGAKVETRHEFQTFDIHMLQMRIDHTFSSGKRQEIFTKYLQLLEVIES